MNLFGYGNRTLSELFDFVCYVLLDFVGIIYLIKKFFCFFPESEYFINS